MTLTINDETWGERFHRAYRRGRARHHFTYLGVAEAISATGNPVSDQTLLRLEQADEAPRSVSQRKAAYLALVAYGFEPEEFGLTVENSGLHMADLSALRRALAPKAGAGKAARARRRTAPRSRWLPSIPTSGGMAA